MRPLVRSLVVALACTGSAVITSAQQAAPTPASTPIDVHQIGPKVGDIVPGFQLPDQAGATRSLPSVLGPSGGLLVFFRSADW